MITTNESKEMYLEVIYELHMKDINVHSVDVAKKFGYSKASVARAISVLKEESYISQEPYGPITLTQKGIDTAKKIKNKHVYLTNFLHLSLGIDKSIAEKDACRIEHVISEKVMDAIEKYVKVNAK